jgi:hypothetical protein
VFHRRCGGLALRRRETIASSARWGVQHPVRGDMLKFIGGTIGLIFLIGLLVVVGLLMLIF